jgi:hypothetical protein
MGQQTEFMWLIIWTTGGLWEVAAVVVVVPAAYFRSNHTHLVAQIFSRTQSSSSLLYKTISLCVCVCVCVCTDD